MKFLSFTPFLFLVLIAAGGCAGQRNPPVAAPSPLAIRAAVTSENLQFLDFHFISLDPADPRMKKAITQDQAVSAALEFEPLGKNASSISAQAGYFDTTDVIDLRNQRLVWLVTYHGVDTVSSGPPGAEHPVAHTLTVAVDALRGVGIVAMTLAVITPGPQASQTPGPGATDSPQALSPAASPQPDVTQDAVITDRATVIKNYAALLAAFNEKLKINGWIRTVHTIVYFDNNKKAYLDPRVMEQWYRIDPDGQLAEGYTWLSASDGAVEQEALYQGGIWYNVTLGGSSRSVNTKVDFTSGLLEELQNGEKITQAAVRYHDANAWRFYFEINDGGLRMARATFIDRDSGLLSGNETYAVQPDGSLQLVSGAIYTSFEINATPPLDRFQQILERSQRMH